MLGEGGEEINIKEEHKGKKLILTTSTDKQLLNTVTQDKLQLPYMKLLPKVHKLTDTASPSNLNKLTGRSIITAHSWTTSNPSRSLGTELDKIILQLKDIFLSIS